MEKIKLSVCGLLVCNEHFLIVKRSETDNFLPNCWEFPGGSVETSETILEALTRELKEEIGLDISTKSAKLIGISEDYMNNGARYLQLNYRIILSKEPTIKLSSEHVAYDWTDAQDARLDSFLKDIIKQNQK